MLVVDVNFWRKNEKESVRMKDERKSVRMKDEEEKEKQMKLMNQLNLETWSPGAVDHKDEHGMFLKKTVILN